MADKHKDRRKDEQNPDFERFDNLAQPFERFEDLARKLFRVPKEELDEKRAERDREKKRAG
jgi:hypothetical protein